MTRTGYVTRDDHYVLHPGIPANVVQFLHLNDNIAIGDPINIVNAKQAEGVVTSTSLEHLQSEYISKTQFYFLAFGATLQYLVLLGATWCFFTVFGTL